MSLNAVLKMVWLITSLSDLVRMSVVFDHVPDTTLTYLQCNVPSQFGAILKYFVAHEKAEYGAGPC